MARLVLFATIIFPLLAYAQAPKPDLASLPVPKRSKYEIGAAMGAFYLPDYPGADESRARFIGLPYLFYRGEIFRADREGGLRGKIVDRDKIKFDFSAAAAFPTNSEDNKAREGMEDLDWVGEIGPRFVYEFHKSKRTNWDFRIPVRYVFSTDISEFDERGFNIGPQVRFRHQTKLDPFFFVSGNIQARWATKKLMQYFYEVEPGLVTAERPEYEAKSGYLATNMSLSGLKVIPKYDIVIFGTVSWNLYQNAANRDSPLLRDESTTSYAMGVAWSFFKSEEKEK